MTRGQQIRVRLGHPSVPPLDSARQEATAAEIHRRLKGQPGLILADEVGMGKTYVALAVAAETVYREGDGSSVVVMVPTSVREKWPLEWRKFSAMLDAQGLPPIRATDETLTSAADFLRLLDDPPSKRMNVIFMTHGALSGNLNDPLVQLAILRQAFKRAPQRLAKQRAVFARWAIHLIPSLGRVRAGDEATVTRLMATPPRRWRPTLKSASGWDFGDDPVPSLVLDVLPELDMEPLIDVLQDLPLRYSASIDRRLRYIRREIGDEVREVWGRALRRVDVRLPLLILDEAHHTKNAGTRLAKLFADEQAQRDADELERGALAGTFDRMLFLTATPFQLGHGELIEVLRRFCGVNWDGLEREAYVASLEDLGRRLDDAKGAALRLDRAWGRLTPDEVAGFDRWWERPQDPALPDRLRGVARHWLETRETTIVAQELMAQLVIRHTRPDRDRRRTTLCGAGITTNDPDTASGLGIAGEAVLPFLLAARAQGVVARAAAVQHVGARALFADGIASSFEAFRQTRSVESPEDLLDDTEGAREANLERTEAVDWYLKHIEAALPDDDFDALGSHPKIAATTSRALALWRDRKKVLIFCFYRATGRALRAHIARAIDREIDKLACDQLALPVAAADEARVAVTRLSRSLQDPEARSQRETLATLRSLLEPHLAGDELLAAVEASMRFVRTPSFLVRYAALEKKPTAAMRAAFAATDGSGQSLRAVIEEFGRFVESRDASERLSYLDAVSSLQVGERVVLGDGGEREAVAPNVRLANGAVASETRQRLMFGFNTPFFPDVLVASSVMAEGVDLHLACRHVIHHDLDWNPSTIEQRTGRLDRIGSKSEQTELPIRVYEPFTQGAQDEKQFRVMKDRERWFNVVMGEKLELDEFGTDRIAERVPLPEAAARGVTMDLAVFGRPSREPAMPGGARTLPSTTLNNPLGTST